MKHKCTNCFYFARTCDGRMFCYAHYPQFIYLSNIEGCDDWEPL